MTSLSKFAHPIHDYSWLKQIHYDFLNFRIKNGEKQRQIFEEFEDIFGKKLNSSMLRTLQNRGLVVVKPLKAPRNSEKYKADPYLLEIVQRVLSSSKTQLRNTTHINRKVNEIPKDIIEQNQTFSALKILQERGLVEQVMPNVWRLNDIAPFKQVGSIASKIIEGISHG